MNVGRNPLPSLVLGLVALAAPSVAQGTTSSCAVKWVDGRPMLKAKLRAGEKTYFCHLLLDLGFSEPLLLHRNAAGSLRAEACDVELGDLRLTGVPFTGKRDRVLEGWTARYAKELEEVPVAGYLGLAAFGNRTLKLDGPGGTLSISAAPPDDEGVPFAGEPGDGLAVVAEFTAGKTARFAFDTREPASHAAPSLLHELAARGGELTRCRVGALDLARSTPFRAKDGVAGTRGGFGGRVLKTCVLLLDLEKRRLWLRQPQTPVWPSGEAALCKALAEGEAALLALLDATSDPAAREEAARVLAAQLLERAPVDEAKVGKVAKVLVDLAPVDRRASTALDLVKGLPEDAAVLREQIALLALPTARQDQNGEAQHALRVELGRAALARGKLDEAYQALLSAVFGMPGQGEPALLLGRVHELRGESERARARYFQALLDTKNTGEAGFEALLHLYEKRHGSREGFVASLLPLAEGRVPALHPVPRDADEIQKTGKVALVELFTGAQCPPCVAADLAVDGLAERYGRDEIAIVVWHLPVPGPEPMITTAGMARAKALGVRGTPTVRIDGDETIVGGGDQDAATKMLERYEKALAPRLQKKPTVDLKVAATREGNTLRCEVRASGELAGARVQAVVLERQLVYAGRNGILFHGAVARDCLFPAEGQAITADQPITATRNLEDTSRELQESIERMRRDGKPFSIEPFDLSKDLDLVVWVEGQDGKMLQATTVALGPRAEERR